MTGNGASANTGWTSQSGMLGLCSRSRYGNWRVEVSLLDVSVGNIPADKRSVVRYEAKTPRSLESGGSALTIGREEKRSGIVFVFLGSKEVSALRFGQVSSELG